MLLSEIAEKLKLTPVTDSIDGNREVTDCYIGDLLSWVMSKAQPGNIWITVMTNINIIAVATLTDVSCIIIPENIVVDEPTVKKANMQGINIFSSSKTSYRLAKELAELI